MPHYDPEDCSKCYMILDVEFTDDSALNDFIIKTGIVIPHRSQYKIEYPITGLDDFF